MSLSVRGGSTGFNSGKQGSNGTSVTFVGATRSPEPCQLAWSNTRTACFVWAERGREAIEEELHRLGTVLVVADHPVAQRLPVHAGSARPSARLMPSSALAIASKRRAARMSHSARAPIAG